MPEPKRKFDVEVVTPPTLKLKPASNQKKQTESQDILRDRQREFGFTQELIFGIIERIKKL